MPRFALMALVLLALVARLAVPAGFMPTFENGMVALTICHGAEIKTIFVPADEAPQSGGQTQTGDTNACAFSIASAATLAGNLSLSIAILTAWLALFVSAYAFMLPGRFSARSGLPRAPPV